MKKAGLVLLFTIICAITFAQAHTYNACCRYGKGNVMGDCRCPGCQKDKDDEIKAAQEETKKLQAIAAAEKVIKDAADKKAKEEAEQKKIADQKLKEENKITIGILNPEKEPVNKPVNKSTEVNDNTFMMPFIEREGERFFGVNQAGYMDTSRNLLFFVGSYPAHASTFHTSNNTYHYSVPFNIGWGSPGKSVDIYHPTGKREFNDNSITTITHLRDNFFILTKSDRHHYLYDIKSKKTTKLPDPPALTGNHSYTPIFDELSYVIPERLKLRGGDYLRFIPENKKLKEKALETFPDKVTEELLKNNSFCLLISYSNDAAFDNHPNATWRPQFVYVSKTGEITIK